MPEQPNILLVIADDQQHWFTLGIFLLTLASGLSSGSLTAAPLESVLTADPAQVEIAIGSAPETAITLAQLDGEPQLIFDPPEKGAKDAYTRIANYAYLFGTCVKASRLVDAELKNPRPDFDREQWLADNVIYREKLKELFNFAVFENDLKWLVWAGERRFNCTGYQ